MSESNPAWHELLEKEEAALRQSTGHHYTVPDGSLDESTFRDRFEEVCEQHGASPSRRLQLYNKCINSCNAILRLSEAVSETAPDLQDLTCECALEYLVWKTLLATLELGCQRGAGHEGVINLLVDLNNSMPKLGPNLDEFREDKIIQESLHHIYCIFIDSYLSIIKIFVVEAFERNHDFLSNPTFQGIITASGTKFSDAKGDYDTKVNYFSQVKEAQQQQTTRRSVSDPRNRLSTQCRRLEFTLAFQSRRFLGNGSHGDVFEVEEESTKELYACKAIDLSRPSLRGSEKKDVKNEIVILKRLRHTHIVTISAYSEEGNGFNILMEPVADKNLGEFLDHCTADGYPPEKTDLIYPWFGCLLPALRFAHSMNVTHRDIKLANILIKGTHVYLSDFSLAKDFTGQDASTSHDEKAKGTMRYRAPETKNNVAGGRKADVFALGCVYSEMFTVTHDESLEAFRNERLTENDSDLFRDCLPTIQNWLHSLSQVKGDPLSDMLVLLIRTMIQENKDKRHSCQQALVLVENQQQLRCTH